MLKLIILNSVIRTRGYDLEWKLQLLASFKEGKKKNPTENKLTVNTLKAPQWRSGNGWVLMPLKSSKGWLDKETNQDSVILRRSSVCWSGYKETERDWWPMNYYYLAFTKYSYFTFMHQNQKVTYFPTSKNQHVFNKCFIRDHYNHWTIRKLDLTSTRHIVIIFYTVNKTYWQVKKRRYGIQAPKS